jgi:hypothetical protein
MLNIMKT